MNLNVGDSFEIDGFRYVVRSISPGLGGERLYSVEMIPPPIGCQSYLTAYFTSTLKIFVAQGRLSIFGHFGATDAPASKKPPCTHSWKNYVGFTQVYKYCEKCDAKQV